jgi:hypothetical protein
MLSAVMEPGTVLPVRFFVKESFLIRMVVMGLFFMGLLVV